MPDTDYKHISSMLEHQSVYGRHGYEMRGDSANSHNNNNSNVKRTYSASSSVKQQTCKGALWGAFVL